MNPNNFGILDKCILVHIPFQGIFCSCLNLIPDYPVNMVSNLQVPSLATESGLQLAVLPRSMLMFQSWLRANSLAELCSTCSSALLVRHPLKQPLCAVWCTCTFFAFALLPSNHRRCEN